MGGGARGALTEGIGGGRVGGAVAVGEDTDVVSSILESRP